MALCWGVMSPTVALIPLEIAARSGRDIKTVYRHLKNLANLGLVAKKGAGYVRIEDPAAHRDAADHRGVEPYCSRATPCPFHDITLSDALETGKPIVYLIGTPAFCQTGICGPVLDVMIGIVDDYPDLQFIHAEVYKNPKAVADLSQADLAPLPATYEMFWEPSLVVTDPAQAQHRRVAEPFAITPQERHRPRRISQDSTGMLS